MALGKKGKSGKTTDNDQRFGSAMLVNNDRKKAGSNQPDYKGWGEVNGEKVWISGWDKESEKGPFVSLVFEPRDDQ